MFSILSLFFATTIVFCCFQVANMEIGRKTSKNN